jgi:predicted HTH transcriptional regulator
MEEVTLIQRISNGEDSTTQFKENITNNDKLVTEIKSFYDKKILIIDVNNGQNKPYSTNKGIYLTKAGSDKRKLSPQELKRLFSESKSLFADEAPIDRTDMSDLNQQLFYTFLKKYDDTLYNKLKSNDLDLQKLLQNFDIMRDENLTLSGNLIFGLEPQRFNKSFYIDCCYFDGNDISVTHYINERRVYGDFETLYTKATDFIKSNLRNRQVEDNFNSNGVPEISHEVIGELLVNALIHRDYHIFSPIKVFIFHDRVEIINPGKLYNALTIEKIKVGTSIRRNQTLDRICNHVLPYTGRGSGIKRVLSINPNIEFENDVNKEEFRCIIPRINNQGSK